MPVSLPPVKLLKMSLYGTLHYRVPILQAGQPIDWIPYEFLPM